MNRKYPPARLALAALFALASLTAWSAPPALRCVIEPDRVAEVGSPVIGVVEAILVERGDVVREGQILARLRANVERASVGAAEVRAEADADVRAAQANFDYLHEKQQRSEELVEKNFISRQALEQVRAEASVAEQKLAQSREQQRIARHELALAKAQLGLRLIRAPFDGIVADRYVTVGERVEEKPIFRVARIDPLRVEIIVPAALYGSVRAGMVAKVTPDLPNVSPVDTRVVLVDKLVDAASNTFRVRSELPNADGSIASGLRCRAEFTAGEPLARADAARPVSGGRLSTDLQTVPAQAGKKN
jgi:membrane fusion protein, heavy metal efflux system